MERIDLIRSHLRQAFSPSPLPDSDEDLALIAEALSRLERRGDLAALQALVIQVAGAAQRVGTDLLRR